MKANKIYNQYRRDCLCDIECESCGHKEIGISAYDDRSFWDNVVPDFKCKNCGKSSNDLGTKKEYISTKYPEDYQI